MVLKGKRQGLEPAPWPKKKDSSANLTDRASDNGPNKTISEIELTGPQRAIVRIARFVAKSLHRIKVWEEIVNDAASFKELIEGLRDDIFSKVEVEPVKVWDELFRYNSSQAASHEGGDILEETGEPPRSPNGILFLTNHERQVDIIALLDEIMRRKRKGQRLGVIASDLLNLKFPEIIPVRIMGLTGDKVASFRDLLNIALAPAGTVNRVTPIESGKMAKAAVETAINILKNDGLVTLAPSAGKKISKKKNWGRFLSFMLRDFARTASANSTLRFKLVLVETSGVRLARLLFFTRYKTGVNLRIKRVVEVVVHKGEMDKGTLTLTYDDEGKQYRLEKGGKLSIDGQEISFEDVVYELWHNEESSGK